MLKAIIFDFDGVIIDTESTRYNSWREAFSWYGLKLKKEEWLQYLGFPGAVFDPHAILEKKSSQKISRNELDSKRKPIFWEQNDKLKIRPGILNFLKDAKKQDIKLAIASSSRREWVDNHLKRLKIRDYFSILKNSDDVERIKPYPDIYLEALKALGVEKSEAVAIEDSFTGVDAAKNAGIFCVFIPNKLNKGLKAQKADKQLGSLKDLPLDELYRII